MTHRRPPRPPARGAAGAALARRRRQAGAGDKSASPAAGLAPRRAARDILVAVETRRAFADVLLGHSLAPLAPADRRLATRLVLGTLAWRGRLDYELAHLCALPLEKLDPPILTALRLGLLQVRHLSRVPAHAAVDTAVTLAREVGSRGAAGLVNAVLRRAARGALALPERADDETGYLAVAYSHPRWLVERLIEWFGVTRAEAIMAADNEAAPNVVRLNLAHGTGDGIGARMAADGIEIARGGCLPETAILASAPHFDCTSYRAGLFHPQSEASQMVARMLSPEPGATVVDCAAAPGGKATHLAELLGPRGRVVAFDLNLRGLGAAREVARTLGHRNIHFVRADVAAAVPMRPARVPFVLLDAPCTGIGTLREHPEIRWRLEPGDFGRMAALQRRMLENAAALVRPGGAIVYAVCSLAPDEGSGVVGDFLAAHPEFAREPPPCPELAPWLGDDGALATSPERGGLDGFFAARMRRRPV